MCEKCLKGSHVTLQPSPILGYASDREWEKNFLSVELWINLQFRVLLKPRCVLIAGDFNVPLCVDCCRCTWMRTTRSRTCTRAGTCSGAWRTSSCGTAAGTVTGTGRETTGTPGEMTPALRAVLTPEPPYPSHSSPGPRSPRSLTESFKFRTSV